MAHCNTVLNQVVGFFKRHEFESLARKHHVGQNFRSFNRWSQFMAMMVCQLSGRKSLRDVVENLKAQGHKLYHLGMKKVTRATLARVNDGQPHELYKELFYKMLSRCQAVAPKHRFKIEEKVYLWMPRPSISAWKLSLGETAPAIVAVIVMVSVSRFLTWPSSCAKTPASSSSLTRVEQSGRHAHRGVLGIAAGGESVGLRIFDDADARHRQRAAWLKLRARYGRAWARSCSLTCARAVHRQGRSCRSSNRRRDSIPTANRKAKTMPLGPPTRKPTVTKSPVSPAIRSPVRSVFTSVLLQAAAD